MPTYPRPSRLMPHPLAMSAPARRPALPAREVLQVGAAYLLEHSEALTEWERGFVAGMSTLLKEGRALTPRQQGWLALIFDRVNH